MRPQITDTFFFGNSARFRSIDPGGGARANSGWTSAERAAGCSSSIHDRGALAAVGQARDVRVEAEQGAGRGEGVPLTSSRSSAVWFFQQEAHLRQHHFNQAVLAGLRRGAETPVVDSPRSAAVAWCRPSTNALRLRFLSHRSAAGASPQCARAMGESRAEPIDLLWRSSPRQSSFSYRHPERKHADRLQGASICPAGGPLFAAPPSGFDRLGPPRAAAVPDVVHHPWWSYGVSWAPPAGGPRLTAPLERR